MLVPTMTPEEIYADMCKDAAWLNDQITYKIYPSVQKKIKRCTIFPFIHGCTLESKVTKNQYNVIFVAYSRGDWNRPCSIIYLKYTHESGKTLIYIENHRFAIRIYTPHFISRYKERMADLVNKFSEISSLDIEAFFMLRNWDVVEMSTLKDYRSANPNSDLTKTLENIESQSRFKKDSDYERYTVACAMGVCLCEKHKTNPNISIYDTFLSPDLLKETQMVDFVPAYSHVMLNAMCREYPRHKDFIVKEWNNSYNKIPEDAPIIPYMVEEINKLLDKFPISALY